ncbi:DUF3368 domain-containing protein [Spirulina sp. CS-785/01]|uniref:DUF3368 domain-containing protein n=1 Tax=Spirulina sp. CS-785/01 TaxID=3021716 RepID=UPI00232DD548|nr:DUF3368 domain-containing protein [Spirulina sp. CS-785/01]MDB9315010.1 DUF3368 domain-containing protein [Spirulina sp. CS-785/01]
MVKTVDLTVQEDLFNLDLLDIGEKTAILMAKQKEADLILIDHGLGRKIAQSYGLNITGLLGILDEAAQQNLVNLPKAIYALQKTTFRASPQLIQTLLQRYPSP